MKIAFSLFAVAAFVLCAGFAQAQTQPDVYVDPNMSGTITDGGVDAQIQDNQSSVQTTDDLSQNDVGVPNTGVETALGVNWFVVLLIVVAAIALALYFSRTRYTTIDTFDR